MPDLGRWFGMDQLSESYESASPYAYVANNPILNNDPDGRVTQDWLINSFWNKSNGTNVSWSNTGSGFESSENIGIDYNGNYTSLNTNYTNGGIGERIVSLPGVSFTGQGNANTWNMGSNYLYNIWAMGNALSQSAADWNFQQKAGAAADKMMWVSGDRGGVIMMDGLSDVVGIALANAKPKNRYLAYALGAAAIVLSKGRAADDVLRAESRAATYSVYQGFENGAVKYVGITKRAPEIRWLEHQAAGGPKSFLQYDLVNGATGLTRAQARTLEQNLINQHGLPNLYNQINSIAPKNWWMYGINP